VKAVKININRCIAVLETKIFVFNLADFVALESFETCPNPKGLCSISSLSAELVLAFPSKRIGFVEVSTEKDPQQRKIEAHKSTICALELCPSGSKVATASEKGTIIRIFDVKKEKLIQ
jgi:WD40 repeat protein